MHMCRSLPSPPPVLAEGLCKCYSKRTSSAIRSRLRQNSRSELKNPVLSCLSEFISLSESRAYRLRSTENLELRSQLPTAALSELIPQPTRTHGPATLTNLVAVLGSGTPSFSYLEFGSFLRCVLIVVGIP